MKRRVKWLVLASVIAAFVSQAQAQEAYSANAIGVIKKTIPGNGSAFISIPLKKSSGVMKFSDTPLMNLPVDSQVSIYDPINGAVWVTGTKAADFRGGWGDFSNRVISIHQPMFVQNGSATDFIAIFTGNIPDDDSIDVPIYGDALMSFANPYPTPLAWSNCIVATECSVSSSAWIWDGNEWIKGDKAAEFRGGWNDFTNRVIEPGDGVFFQDAGANSWTWTAEKPYVWPGKEDEETND